MSVQKESKEFLLEILGRSAAQKSLDWLQSQVEKLVAATAPAKFFLAFSQASRHFRKDTLTVSEADKAKASTLVEGFEPAFGTNSRRPERYCC